MEPPTLSIAFLLSIFAIAPHVLASIADNGLAPVAPVPPPSTAVPDSPQCASENLTDFFNPPSPGASLVVAFYSHEMAQNAPCQSTATDRFWGCSPNPCGFSTAGPSSLLPTYLTFLEGQYSWWSARASAAVSLAENCPLAWYTAGKQRLGYVGLNVTVTFAECYAEAIHTTLLGGVLSPTTAVPGAKSTGGPSATGSGVSPTQTKASGAVGKAEVVRFWTAVGGVLAAVVGSAW